MVHTDFDPFTPEAMEAARRYRAVLRRVFDLTESMTRRQQAEKLSHEYRTALARIVGRDRVGQCVAQTVVEDTRAYRARRGPERRGGAA
jgi:hypothetical protein